MGVCRCERSNWKRRTLMRTPVVKRQTFPLSGLRTFFRGFHLGAVRLWQRLLTAFPSEEQTARGCTTHFLRLCHQRPGESRAPACAFSAAEKLRCPLIPSDAKEWLHRWCAPVRRRCGRGAAHVHLVRPSPDVKEPEQGSNQSRGLRAERLCPLARAMTQRCRALPRTIGQAAPMRVQ